MRQLGHAERNAIYWAAGRGVRLSGCSIFLTSFPCLECGLGIILMCESNNPVHAQDAKVKVSSMIEDFVVANLPYLGMLKQMEFTKAWDSVTASMKLTTSCSNPVTMHGLPLSAGGGHQLSADCCPHAK